MNSKWKFKKKDINKIQNLVEQQKDNSLVIDRININLSDEKKDRIGKEEFWDHMVCALLTTMARIKEGNRLDIFMQMEPFPLRLSKLSNQRNVQAFITKVLKKHKATRWYNKFGDYLARNYNALEAGKWKETLKEVNRLREHQGQEPEREVANYLQKLLIGYGPKQSRNLLQFFGFTRYEIPIDSRVMKWMKAEIKFPMTLDKDKLSSTKYYEALLDCIIQLCDEADVSPCVLDGAIFSLGSPRSRTNNLKRCSSP